MNKWMTPPLLPIWYRRLINGQLHFSLMSTAKGAVLGQQLVSNPAWGGESREEDLTPSPLLFPLQQDGTSGTEAAFIAFGGLLLHLDMLCTVTWPFHVFIYCLSNQVITSLSSGSTSYISFLYPPQCKCGVLCTADTHWIITECVNRAFKDEDSMTRFSDLQLGHKGCKNKNSYRLVSTGSSQTRCQALCKHYTCQFSWQPHKEEVWILSPFHRWGKHLPNVTQSICGRADRQTQADVLNHYIDFLRLRRQITLNQDIIIKSGEVRSTAPKALSHQGFYVFNRAGSRKNGHSPHAISSL